MASGIEFVRYVCEQMADAGMITYKKMFGEYGVYCEGKIIGLICDDQFFLKPTDAGRAVYPDAEEAPPYAGAKPYLLIDCVDDRELMTRLVRETWPELPEPKPKKKK